ncbi:Similar to TMEM65: Transmembrane protein 65 (Homo sapiens) [Cotesia congregata]|uniref:Similar to TMEM65: Transmembrane protein 65 (Homo sapiens) n=1 Tax=Cotesia congregata TaxID=51543 RepID=A0A8J2H8W2_COTCN|nr:Similar to TMEM65: Transmembrane protein 65 (Homo sapiens) [Cotesia congregata]
MCTSLSVLSQTSFNTSILKLGNKLKCCQTLGLLVIKLDNTTRRLYVKNIPEKLSPANCSLSASSFNYHQRLSYGTTAIVSGVPGALSKQQAKDLAVRLTSEEREVLIAALKECQSNSVRAEYEGQLAAFRWRSKFGRPTGVPSLGEVDPTGSYCAVPDDWLLRKYAETVPQPTRRDLMRVSIANAIPFIGFGFLDNFFMIIAGEHIEAYLGAIISISTMAAAALGNTISDILGIGSATYVERLAQKIGFKPPKLTPIQLDLPRSRRAANMLKGRVIGVTIGCILGMTPLFLLHTETKEEKEKGIVV